MVSERGFFLEHVLFYVFDHYSSLQQQHYIVVLHILKKKLLGFLKIRKMLLLFAQKPSFKLHEIVNL